MQRLQQQQQELRVDPLPASRVRHESIGHDKKQPYEVHVTIQTIEDTTAFVELCNNWTEYAAASAGNINTEEYGLKNSKVLSCKAIIILLPEGVHKMQPMCSMFVNGTLDQAIKWGELFGEYCCSQQGYIMVRNKVEARLCSVPDGTPTVRGQPIHESNAIYWEFHIKLKFVVSDSAESTEARIDKFRLQLMEIFPYARLSRSAMSSVDVSGQGWTSRIVTLRLYDGNKKSAQDKLEELMSFLQGSISDSFNFTMKKEVEKELSVYDSNVSNDLGWIHMNTDELTARKWFRN